MSNPAAPVQPVVAGVLVRADGHVLLAQRPAGKELAGCWEFPGGKVEPGESELAALKRELAEELAIETQAIDPRPLARVPIAQPGRALLLCAYRVRRWAGVIRGCEGQAWAWHSLTCAADLDLAPADRHILAALAAPAPR